MSDPTKTQIETWLNRVKDGHDITHTYKESRALYEMALRSLDHAADARLGATLARFFRDLDDVDREKFYDRLASYYSGEAADLINELDAIDLTMSEEQADAVRGEGR